MSKTFKIKIDILGLVVNCHCGKSEEFTEKFGIPSEAITDRADGATVLYDGQHYLWLSGNDLYNVVPHEALHLVYDIFSSREMNNKIFNEDCVEGIINKASIEEYELE